MSIHPRSSISGSKWFIDVDDNRNAAVEVRYRKAGETSWKQAQPLLRIGGEEIYNGAQLDVVTPNMFAGRLTNGSAGVLFYNNTILSETTAQGTSNVHWRNNLFRGENTTPSIFTINTFTNCSSSDYNGFRTNPGAEFSFQWNSPPAAVVADFTGPGHQAALETPSSSLWAETIDFHASLQP